MPRYRRGVALTAIVCGAAWFAPAAAQHRAGGLIDALADCRSIGDGDRRLACLDAATDALVAARQGMTVSIMTPSEAARREAAVPIETLDSTVTRLSLAGRDLFNVSLKDGTIWRTTEPSRFPIAIGDPVHVRQGALGSYLASFKGRRSIRVRRVK